MLRGGNVRHFVVGARNCRSASQLLCLEGLFGIFLDHLHYRILNRMEEQWVGI